MNSDRKPMQPNRISSGPPARIKKWDKFTQIILHLPKQYLQKRFKLSKFRQRDRSSREVASEQPTEVHTLRKSSDLRRVAKRNLQYDHETMVKK